MELPVPPYGTTSSTPWSYPKPATFPELYQNYSRTPKLLKPLNNPKNNGKYAMIALLVVYLHRIIEIETLNA
jgi:hypothetical protein